MTSTPSDSDERLYVYIVRFQGNYLYIGLARDVKARLEEFERGKGPDSLNGKRPVELAYVRQCASFPEARALAKLLKGYTRERKERLIAAFQQRWQSSPEQSLEQAYQISMTLPLPSVKPPQGTETRLNAHEAGS